MPGTDQRNAIAYASVVDLDEAYGVGCHAVEIARKDGNGWMATILRDRSQASYNVRFDKVPLEKVANSERFFPKHWMRPSRIDVTDEFLAYARPLIGDDWVSVPLVDGLARFARIAKKLAPKRLADYVPRRTGRLRQVSSRNGPDVEIRAGRRAPLASVASGRSLRWHGNPPPEGRKTARSKQVICLIP